MNLTTITNEDQAIAAFDALTANNGEPHSLVFSWEPDDKRDPRSVAVEFLTTLEAHKDRDELTRAILLEFFLHMVLVIQDEHEAPEDHSLEPTIGLN